MTPPASSAAVAGVGEMDASRTVVLATFGTLGDLYPFIACARALQDRGFDPTIVAPRMHRAAIEAEGIRYARLRPDNTDITDALGIDIPGAFRRMLKNPHFILDEIYMRFLMETYEDVLAAGEGARAILTLSSYDADKAAAAPVMRLHD